MLPQGFINIRVTPPYCCSSHRQYGKRGFYICTSWTTFWRRRSII